MIKTNLVGTYGYSLICRSFTLDFTDLQGTSGAGIKTFNLDQLPQGSFMVAIRVKHSVAFSGGALTGMLVRVGKSGGATNFFTPDFDVFQAVADGTLQETFALAMGQLSPVTPTVSFTPAGANNSAATAGQVQVDLLFYPISTPNAL